MLTPAPAPLVESSAKTTSASAVELETVRLLRFESVQLRTPTTTMATFYEGRPPLDYIRDKVRDICHKNPWLQGRLSRKKGRLYLTYAKQSPGIESSLKIVRLPSLRHDMSFSELNRVLDGLIVPRGSQSVDRDQDLFRVVVAQIDDEKFAVVVSVSHAYADGHTFYEVHKMLSVDEPVRALIVDRVYTSRQDMEALIRGGDDTLPWMGSPAFAVNALGSLLRGRKPAVNLTLVDQQKLEQRKRDYAATHAPRFISANDIITSEFFAATDCDIIFMTVNFRDRIPHLTKYHAGNYQAVLAFQREDYARPDLIRGALTDFRRVVSGDLPGFFRSTRVTMGAITNLATPYQDVHLPDCRLSFHRPVVDSAPFFPFEHTVYIVKSHDEQLALVTCCKDPSVLPKVDILGDRIV